MGLNQKAGLSLELEAIEKRLKNLNRLGHNYICS